MIVPLILLCERMTIALPSRTDEGDEDEDADARLVNFLSTVSPTLLLVLTLMLSLSPQSQDSKIQPREILNGSTDRGLVKNCMQMVGR
jgi:hypothetical protein